MGGIIDELKPGTINAVLLRYLFIICFISVDVFGMLTGWLNYEKTNISWNRIIGLLFSTVFWCTIITSVMAIAFGNRMSGLQDYIISLFPPLKGRYWYIVSYVFVYFMIPYMNKLIATFDKRTYTTFLVILFVLLSVIPTVGKTDFFRTSTGSSPFWLIACYFMGAYLKKYKNESLNKKKCMIVFMAFSIFVLVWWMLLEGITIKLRGTPQLTSYWTSAYYSPIVVIMASISLLLFANIGKQAKERKTVIIAKISSTMFGVYIIHAHSQLWDNVIEPIIQRNANVIVSQNAISCLLLSLLGIFLIAVSASVLEILRMQLFRGTGINKVEDKLSELLNKRFPIC